MYQSDLDIDYARERYEDYLVAARIRRLIRSAQAAEQPATQPPAAQPRKDSLTVRILDALRPRRAARA
jgi:hypothetical protein